MAKGGRTPFEIDGVGGLSFSLSSRVYKKVERRQIHKRKRHPGFSLLIYTCMYLKLIEPGLLK
jgi:hypothetical protein